MSAYANFENLLYIRCTPAITPSSGATKHLGSGVDTGVGKDLGVGRVEMQRGLGPITVNSVDSDLVPRVDCGS